MINSGTVSFFKEKSLNRYKRVGVNNKNSGFDYKRFAHDALISNVPRLPMSNLTVIFAVFFKLRSIPVTVRALFVSYMKAYQALLVLFPGYIRR